MQALKTLSRRHPSTVRNTLCRNIQQNKTIVSRLTIDVQALKTQLRDKVNPGYKDT